MLKKYYWLVIVATSITTVASEERFSVFYSCPTVEAGQSCSRQCAKIGNIKFDVRDKSKSGNVNVTLFTENEVAPETLKNCQVKNSKNWVCQTTEIFQEQSYSMTDGVYFVKKVFRMLDGEDDISIYCARLFESNLQ